MSESRAQRQAALEERKRRIAELREARSRRQEDTARVQASATANLDDFVTGLLNEPSPVPVADANKDAAASSAAAETSAPAANTDRTAPGTASESLPPSAAPVPASVAPAPARQVVETFTIGTQTEEPEPEPAETETPEPLDESAAGDTGEGTTDTETPADQAPPKILSQEQVQKEVMAPSFSAFLNNASKKVERVLASEQPVWVDPLEQSSSHLTSGEETASHHKFLTDRTTYRHEKWTTGRQVTSMDWSPLSRDLFLSTYTDRSSSSNNPTSSNTATARSKSTPADSLTPRSGELQSDGLLVVWSLSLPQQRPEHVLTCGSSVLCGRFHPVEANLIVGGCASGQVVVWDVRAGRLPVQTSASVIHSSGNSGAVNDKGAVATGHVHAIHSMQVLEGGAGFVTASSDGKVNFWSLSNLREPAESMQIGDSLSSLAVAPESGTLLFGDDTGALHTSAAQGRRRQGARKLQEGHYGMVTSISTQASPSSTFDSKLHNENNKAIVKGFYQGPGGLVLTAGVDWTVQLWAPAYTEKPITSIVSHSYDYMSDARWSPASPSIFATASTNGRLGLWNWAQSLEEPVTTIPLEKPINKLQWSADGRRLAVAVEDSVEMLTWSEEAIRPTKAAEDGKTMMNSFFARGWIQNRQ